MKKILFSLLLGLIAIYTSAQVFDSKNAELVIKGLDSFKFSRSFVPSREAYSFFNTLAGDTIIFNGNGAREDFFSNDTIWMKRNAKKPIEGKHYKINKHYKTIDGDVSSPSDSIYNKQWVIVAAEIESGGNLFESDKNEYLIIKDVLSGDVVRWRYRKGYNYSENVNVTDITKSKLFNSELRNIVLYENSGTKYMISPIFKECHIVNSFVTIETRDRGNSIHFTTTVLLDNNESYNIPFTERYTKNSKTLYTEVVKKAELDKLRDSGQFKLVLSKVEKPKNPQIRYGKTTTLTDKSVTKYSYTDNLLTIVLVDESVGIDFSLSNKSGNTIKIEWNEASFIDINNSASRVFHSGVKYIDRGASMPASVIPNGTTIDDVIMPTNLTSYYSGDWSSSSLIPNRRSYDEAKIGKTVKILLPINVKGVINEYTFIFKVEWKWDYPELRNESIKD